MQVVYIRGFIFKYNFKSISNKFKLHKDKLSKLRYLLLNWHLDWSCLPTVSLSTYLNVVTIGSLAAWVSITKILQKSIKYSNQ